MQDMRYASVGDWIIKDEELVIYVADTGNWKYNMAVAIHEQVEALACHAQGITTKQVDDFDLPWEEHDGLYEPGEDPHAPYHKQHMSSMAIEEILYEPHMLDINSDDFEAALDKLYDSWLPKAKNNIEMD